MGLGLTVAKINQLLNNSDQTQTPFSNHGPGSVASADALLDHFSPHPSTPQHIQHPDLQSEWMHWIEAEARQRLLCSCFMYDVHQSIYHEQSRSKADLEEYSQLLYLPCPEPLWNASCASEWQAQRADYAVQPLHIIERDLSLHGTVNRSIFTQSLIVCSLATRLPTRDDPTYPNDYLPESMDPTIITLRSLFPDSLLVQAYLALHHTPLHDLLAIAGDTWVFARKITPPSAFHSAQSRLKTWSSSLAAAAATQYACQHLSTVLSQPLTPTSSDNVQSYGPQCITDYWALYVCTLICWAFGHRYQYSGGSSGSTSRSSSSTAIDTSGMELDSPQTPVDEGRLKALTYIRGMLELGTEDLLTSKASMRGDTGGVIDAVRARLELDNLGGKSSMLVDAMLVLTRLKEGGRARFF